MDTSILQTISGLGVTGITLIIVYLWIKKDQQYTDLANRVTTAFEQHSQTTTELKNVVQASNSIVEANTKVIEKLQETMTTQVFEVLRSQRS